MINSSRKSFIRGIILSLVGIVPISASSSQVNALREGGSPASPQDSQRDYERLRRIMMPLIRASNQSRRVGEIRVRIIDQPDVNAGSAGGGEFLVTSALLRRANDEQLRGVLAHEIAHDDLGHPAKMQVLGVGLNLGAVLMEKVFPGSGNLAPIASTLIATSYGRPRSWKRTGMQ